MQFVEGVSLQEKLDSGGITELSEILRIGLQTAEGLATGHKRGLVHGGHQAGQHPAGEIRRVELVKITDFGPCPPTR